MSQCRAAGTVEHAVQMAAAAIERVLGPNGGDVSAAVETQLQNAVYLVRSSSSDRQLRSRLEDMAASVRILAEAKRQGRTNLYTSRLLRLRRLMRS